jgi:hypothetical protein
MTCGFVIFVVCHLLLSNVIASPISNATRDVVSSITLGQGQSVLTYSKSCPTYDSRCSSSSFREDPKLGPSCSMMESRISKCRMSTLSIPHSLKFRNTIARYLPSLVYQSGMATSTSRNLVFPPSTMIISTQHRASSIASPVTLLSKLPSSTSVLDQRSTVPIFTGFTTSAPPVASNPRSSAEPETSCRPVPHCEEDALPAGGKEYCHHIQKDWFICRVLIQTHEKL